MLGTLNHFTPEVRRSAAGLADHIGLFVHGFAHTHLDAPTADQGLRNPIDIEPAVGIFAQRGKNRPHRIGSTIRRVLRRDGRRLVVAELDAIDGAPVIDVKPVMREFLPREAVRQPDWVAELMARDWARTR